MKILQLSPHSFHNGVKKMNGHNNIISFIREGREESLEGDNKYWGVERRYFKFQNATCDVFHGNWAKLREV